jgi:hypothetical protein
LGLSRQKKLKLWTSPALLQKKNTSTPCSQTEEKLCLRRTKYVCNLVHLLDNRKLGIEKIENFIGLYTQHCCKILDGLKSSSYLYETIWPPLGVTEHIVGE